MALSHTQVVVGPSDELKYLYGEKTQRLCYVSVAHRLMVKSRLV